MLQISTYKAKNYLSKLKVKDIEYKQELIEMFQMYFTLSEKNESWLESIKEILTIKLKRFNGVMASINNSKRIYCSIACENHFKQPVISVLTDIFSDMFCTIVKKNYLEQRLVLPMLTDCDYNVLIQALSAFDREVEKDLIIKDLKIVDGFSLDGFYNFRMAGVLSRWSDIITLTRENSAYLFKDEVYFDLMRFLIGLINPKIPSLEISEDENQFNILGKLDTNSFKFSMFSKEQLMLYLVDVAPVEVKLNGDFSDKAFYRQITSIFDTKSVTISSN